eukprot:m.260833 g.260833  ORF g.260833 m.260833 type:complete len:170 (+) comp40743_c0_seq1:209-718(+)
MAEELTMKVLTMNEVQKGGPQGVGGFVIIKKMPCRIDKVVEKVKGTGPTANDRVVIKGTNIFTGKPVEDTFNLTAGFDGIVVPIATKMTYSLLDIDDGHLTLLNADGETKDGDVMLAKPQNVDEDESAWDPIGMEVVKRFDDGEALKITVLSIMGSEIIVAVARDRDLE